MRRVKTHRSVRDARAWYLSAPGSAVDVVVVGYASASAVATAAVAGSLVAAVSAIVTTIVVSVAVIVATRRAFALTCTPQRRVCCRCGKRAIRVQPARAVATALYRHSQTTGHAADVGIIAAATIAAAAGASAIDV